MTTFITGGTSLLGRVMVQELVRQGEAVRILVRPDSNRSGLELPGVAFVRGEIHDLVDVRKGIAGCDWVCHLTGPADANVSEAEGWRAQLEGTRNVLQAAQDIRSTAVVQVSSLIALGPTQPGESADEAHQAPAGGQLAAYQKSQRAADDLAREYGAKGLPVKLVYPGFGYGSARAARPASLLQQTLLRLAAGQAGAIVGNGRNRIAATYLKDVAQGIILAHTHGRPGEGYLPLGSWRVQCRDGTLVKAEQELAGLFGFLFPAGERRTGSLLCSAAAYTANGAGKVYAREWEERNGWHKSNGRDGRLCLWRHRVG